MADSKPPAKPKTKQVPPPTPAGTKGKPAPAAKKDKPKKEEFATEHVLQAIILADNFDAQFEPISLEMARALLPLVNTPMIDYTIEFLASAGVKEIFVFCRAHADQIEKHLKQRYPASSDLVVRPIVSLKALGAGDALREMHDRQLIQGDFVLVSGDCVSNMRLDAVLKHHSDQKLRDRDTIMTMVFKQAAPGHRTRSLEDDTVVALDTSTSQLLFMNSDPEKVEVSLDVALFDEHSEVQTRYDLIDCRIDICCPEVLDLFTDNFDYQDLRTDFIRGVCARDSELLGQKVFCHIVSDEYAARVKDLRTYDSVSKDILRRWVHPMTPANNWTGLTHYRAHRQCVYLEHGVHLAWSVRRGQDVVIGSGTVVQDNTYITESVIGRNCKIGSNVTLKGAHLFDNVTIEDGVCVEHSIVCSGARLLQGCSIKQNCVISFNVVVGEGASLASSSRLTTTAVAVPEDMDLDDEEAQFKEPVQVMIGGHAAKKWVLRRTDTRTELLPNRLALSMRSQDESLWASDDESSHDSQDEDGEAPEEKFSKEVRDMVLTGIQEEHPIENVLLQIKSMRLAYDVTYLDCARAVLPSILRSKTIESKTPAELQKLLVPLLKKWGKLLASLVTSTSDQEDIIWVVQEFCEDDDTKLAAKIFPIILHTLYNLEVIEDAAILRWEKESLNADDKSFLKASTKFLEWLKEDDSDDE